MHSISNRSGALLALVTAVALSGCGNLDFDTSQVFAKPIDLFGHSSGGYSFSELQENRQQRTVTANDLVQQNGACAARPVPPQSQPNPATPSNAGAVPPAAPAADALLGGGIALGMSECDVVYRAGQPSAVQLGQNPNGDRTAVLTFEGGPRPGVYRFRRGQLVEMDGTERPSPPPSAPAQATKKKPANAKKPAKSNDAA